MTGVTVVKGISLHSVAQVAIALPLSKPTNLPTRMHMNEVKLYKKHANSVGEWHISSEGSVINIWHSSTIGGAQINHREVVQTNLSGRTLEEQVKLRIASRVSRMMDRGYKPTHEEAIKNPGNQLGLDRPMLAQKIRDVRNPDLNGAVLQKKLDGHRDLTTRQDGEIIAYSRLGKPIPSIEHILAPLRDRLPEGETLDGELYCHGYPLQTLGSWIKRLQPDTKRLSYVVYDVISDMAYKERHRYITELLAGIETGTPGKIIVLPYREYEGSEQQASWFKEVRKDGFEGLMMRLDRRPYEVGKRSSSLLKIKEFLDAEFKVIDFKPSKTGWAICVCLAPNGTRFDCSAPGDHSEKQHVMDHPELYRNRMMTVEFAHWTLDGIPFQPNATRWHEVI